MNKVMHVLDIGCGHGQDIIKWKNNNIAYLVGVDLAKKSL
jgi:ubiquinone/menaquinone biosynthesis C-methylase UbiE